MSRQNSLQRETKAVERCLVHCAGLNVVKPCSARSQRVVSGNTNHGLCTSWYCAVTYMYAVCITSFEITTAKKGKTGLEVPSCSAQTSLDRAGCKQDNRYLPGQFGIILGFSLNGLCKRCLFFSFLSFPFFLFLFLFLFFSFLVFSCLFFSFLFLQVPAGVPVVLSIIVLLQHLALTRLVAPLRVVVHQEIRQQAGLWVQPELMLQHCNGGVHNLLPLLCTLCVFLLVKLSSQQPVIKPIAPKQGQSLVCHPKLTQCPCPGILRHIGGCSVHT